MILEKKEVKIDQFVILIIIIIITIVVIFILSLKVLCLSESPPHKGETSNQVKSREVSWNQMLVFCDKDKPENMGDTLSRVVAIGK